MVGDLLIVHPVATAPAFHHSDLMLAKREWQLYLVLLEEADLDMAVLVVDLVVVLIHPHGPAVKIGTERSQRRSP